MKIILIILLLLPLGGILINAQDEPRTVDKVDLRKYSGLWYEIAKIPNRFQKHCVKGTTAQYILTEEGELIVINKCIEEDGETDEAEGVARVADRETNSKLEVSFVSFLGIRPFWGDYWIIGLGENYEFAVIGSPDRKYGWILSRTPSLSEEKFSRISEILLREGYNPSDFVMTDQSH